MSRCGSPFPVFTSNRALALIMAAELSAQAQFSVWTSHNDNARTGLNANESVLTHTNVNQNGFGKLFSQPVDGQVYAQPLYVPNVAIPGKGSHNAVFVATMHDSVYAFDADTDSGSNAPPLWHVSFLNPSARITAPHTSDAVPPGSGDCGTFTGEIGIVGTPVIDVGSGTLYVVARTKEPLPPPNGQILVQVQRLHALDISTGTERPGSPTTITGSVSGSGDGSSGGVVSFNPAYELQRSALLLSQGMVYVTYASYCDLDPYHGWIFGFDANTLQPVSAWNNTPNGNRGGIWMGQSGPAAAPDGAVFCITGNGSFDTSGSPKNFGDSFVKLNAGTNLSVADYFTPYNQASLASADLDLGSGGALVLPDSTGSPAHPHLLVGCGKEGKIYLLDRDNLGHFNAANDSQIVQGVVLGSTVFGPPAFFNNRIYYQGVGLPLKAFAISNAVINPAPVTQTTDTATFRGAIPSVSSHGTAEGIVWELVPTPTLGVSGLRAYNADDLSQKLYDSYLSWQAGAPDRITFVKFAVPTVANGKVYVGTTNALAVFGLRSIIWSITRQASPSEVHIVFSGPDGQENVLQASSDLISWMDLGPGSPTGSGTYSYSEPISPTVPTRFYRVKPQ
ncbi:MAG TPA: pyrrolo-quinoline quinone [Verrucomicrobiae bacterium]|nr:pyrrolo-quinoline quinone [Verrucomicrobiae bacterium]